MPCVIKKVEPVAGLIPSLRLTASLRLEVGSPNARLFVTKWLGEIAFSTKPEPANQTMPAGPTNLRLPATWDSEPLESPQYSSSETHATFTCEMTPPILDALERFRAGGRLFVRVRGQFQVFVLGSYEAQPDEVLGMLTSALTDPMRGLWQDVRGDSHEIARDVWSGEILRNLRPPGRVILEAQLPRVDAGEEHGRRALGHLNAAQLAFDDGRYYEAARLVYKAGEALQNLGRMVEERYGELAQKSVAKQNSALQALCNTDRHDESNVVGGHDTDRAMALHLIMSMKSLAAIYMAGPRPE